ncbi:STM3941 family protein [Brachyspira innocens]|uniref:STM3941 family protein n=1 Tax=Brachyspira innocens TaxID=13264 RepID=A0ABT8YUW2_9SPIR|nr:STM3941 family protein [Brachyspira innocens]MDO7019351.1 STM3941 family protein [Brachyspira innocens]
MYKDLPKIEIYNSKRKLALLLLFSSVFIVISILAFLHSNSYKKILFTISLLFFLICFLVFIVQLLKSGKPIIILDENGIMYNILLKNKNIFVKWIDIKEIYFSKTFIYLYLKEESSILMNRKNPDEPIVFYMSELKMKKDTVIAMITYYFEKSTGII